MDHVHDQPPLLGRNQPLSAPAHTEQERLEMLDAIASFLRRYLICDDHQLTLLTLWVVHTWCYMRFLTTAYLDIRSPQSQSGKSRCLELLNMLCNEPWCPTGATPGTIKDRLLHQRAMREITTQDRNINIPPPHTMLLDNCHHILGSSERQPLVAMLTSGARQTSIYAWGADDYFLFGPKAFAGNGQLPRSLAGHCIPIVLRRKKPSETVPRFNRDSDRLPAKVRDWLPTLANHPYLLSRKTLEPPPKLPPYLTARQQDCAEPLLHLADIFGGPWPQKARVALSLIFDVSDWSDSMRALRDVRAWFYMKKYPECLLTRDLLPLLMSMENRPWSGWRGTPGRKLGALLHPFGIVSRNITMGEEKNLKGYLLTDLTDAWERYLPPLVVDAKVPTAENGT